MVSTILGMEVTSLQLFLGSLKQDSKVGKFTNNMQVLNDIDTI